MEQANRFEFQNLYEMCLKSLMNRGESLWVPDSVRDVFEELDELDSSYVLVSASFIIGFSRLIGGIGSGFIIIFSFINESLNPVITTLFGNDLLLSLFIILYSTSYAIVSLSNWLKFKIYVFRFRNFSVFFYIVYCNITW